MNKFLRILRFEFFSITAKKSWVIPTILLITVGLLAAFLPQIAGLFGFDDFPGSTMSETIIPSDYSPPTTGVVLDGDDVTRDDIIMFLPQTIFYDSQEELEQAILADEISEAYVIHSIDHYTPVMKDSTPFMGNYYPFDQFMLLIREHRFLGDAVDFPAYRAAMDRPIEHTPVILGADAQTNYGFTYGLVFVVYFLVMFYGSTVATSVAREKSDRTMELLITSANPSKLFYGKVFGAGLAGLLQFGLLVGSVFLAFSLNHQAWGFNILRYFAIPPKVWLIFLSFTLTGYLLYLFFFAMLGATVSKVEDVASASSPLTMLMVASFIAVNFSMSNPDSLIMKVISYVPFSSPIAMFARSSLGSGVSDIEIVISFLLLLASTIFSGFVSSKLYRLGTLNYGNRLKLGQAIKLLRRDAE
ncbi:MAG: ABC transporter permease [Tissierellia bacterium]|nr:ABC transporter permease [Tissierellia bacterium]